MPKPQSTALQTMKDAGAVPQDFQQSAEDEQVVQEAFRQIPSHLHKHVHEIVDRGCEGGYRLFAAAAAAILVREEMQPNSAFTMLPTGWTATGTFAPSTAFPLLPYINGVAQPAFNFVFGQRFFGIMTGKTDVANSWYIAAGTLKFSVDAISGIQAGDCSFASFEEDVVLGRMILAEYTRHEILESIPFTASAVNYAAAAVRMTEGLTVQYWDERCMNARLLSSLFNVKGVESFSSLVQDLVAMAGSGHPATRLAARIRRHRASW